jgi:hypothetical protein
LNCCRRFQSHFVVTRLAEFIVLVRLSTLNEGAVIEYELVANKGKEAAENIKVK